LEFCAGFGGCRDLVGAGIWGVNYVILQGVTIALRGAGYYPLQRPNSLPFERLQRRAKSSRMLARSPSSVNYANSLQQADELFGGKLLAWCPRRLKGFITFFEDLKNFWRYSDREWIVIILLSISILKIFRGLCTICASGRGHSPVESELNVKIWSFFLILIAR
jgi:hypothetical protein